MDAFCSKPSLIDVGFDCTGQQVAFKAANENYLFEAVPMGSQLTGMAGLTANSYTDYGRWSGFKIGIMSIFRPEDVINASTATFVPISQELNSQGLRALYEEMLKGNAKVGLRSIGSNGDASVVAIGALGSDASDSGKLLLASAVTAFQSLPTEDATFGIVYTDPSALEAFKNNINATDSTKIVSFDKPQALKSLEPQM